MAPARFILELPSVPAYIGTARLFAGAVARHYGVEEQEVEDLKLAVSEACTSSMRHQGGDEPVRLVATPSGRVLRVEVEGAAALAPSPSEDTDEMAAGLGVEIVRALFPDVEATSRRAGEAGIAFSVPIPDAPPGEPE